MIWIFLEILLQNIDILNRSNSLKVDNWCSQQIIMLKVQKYWSQQIRIWLQTNWIFLACQISKQNLMLSQYPDTKNVQKWWYQKKSDRKYTSWFEQINIRLSLKLMLAKNPHTERFKENKQKISKSNCKKTWSSDRVKFQKSGKSMISKIHIRQCSTMMISKNQNLAAKRFDILAMSQRLKNDALKKFILNNFKRWRRSQD